jgi:DNA-binding response OmpR family regulator
MSRILVVEDDAPFREMLRKVLERAGHEVEEAKNGSVALERYRQQTSDLIITDLVMPDKEGIETIIDFRRLNPGVKIIAISGGGQVKPKVTLAMALRLGASRALAKPFTPQELLAAVDEVLAEVS